MSSDNLGRTCVIFEDITFKTEKTKCVFLLGLILNQKGITIGIRYIRTYVQIAYRYYPEGV